VLGDLDRGDQALSVVPMIESRQAIAARIGRRKHLDASPRDLGNDGPDANVSANPEGPGGKLEEEGGMRMLVAVAVRWKPMDSMTASSCSGVIADRRTKSRSED